MIYFNTSTKNIYLNKSGTVYTFNGNNTTYSDATTGKHGLLSTAWATDLTNLNSTASSRVTLGATKTIASTGFLQSTASSAPLYAIVSRFTASSEVYTSVSMVSAFSTSTSPTSATPCSLVGSVTKFLSASGALTLGIPTVTITATGGYISWETTSGIAASVSSNMTAAVYSLRLQV